MEKGADATEERDASGKTSLHLAAACGQVGVLMVLAEELEGAVLRGLRDARGFTPLHWAAYKGHEGCVEYLLKDVEDLGKEGDRGFTPLHCAVCVRKHDLLLNQIHFIDGDFECNRQQNSYQCLKLILNKFGQPSDVNRADSRGMTPLHIAGATKDRSKLFLKTLH